MEIAPGETFGLLGPNGAGKTTTIRMLTTLLKPMEGSVAVFGVSAAAQPMIVRRVIGYVPQLLSADATLTGRENVELFARLFDVPRKVRAERGASALAAMGLEDAADRIVKTYSGGMIRRLELAQALVSAPRLLVLDEPTVGLEPIARTDVWDYIAGLRAAAPMTVLMTTHYMDEADTYCDRIALMHAGRIRATGSPAELKGPWAAAPPWTTCSATTPAGRWTTGPRREGSAMSAAPGALHAASAEPLAVPLPTRRLPRCAGSPAASRRSAGWSCARSGMTGPSCTPGPSSRRCGC